MIQENHVAGSSMGGETKLRKKTRLTLLGGNLSSPKLPQMDGAQRHQTREKKEAYRLENVLKMKKKGKIRDAEKFKEENRRRLGETDKIAIGHFCRDKRWFGRATRKNARTRRKLWHEPKAQTKRRGKPGAGREEKIC